MPCKNSWSWRRTSDNRPLLRITEPVKPVCKNETKAGKKQSIQQKQSICAWVLDIEAYTYFKKISLLMSI